MDPLSTSTPPPRRQSFGSDTELDPPCPTRLARESDARLLALAAGCTEPEDERLAETWLARAGGIEGLCAWLSRGEGPRAGVRHPLRLAASLTLARRLAPAWPPRRRIASPAHVAAECEEMRAWSREGIAVLALDGTGCLKARETVALGRANAASATPADVLGPAIRRYAAALVVVHNHPSGDPEPSEQDAAFTEAVARGAAAVGVELLDHVIVARGGFVSMRARGLLDAARSS